MTAPDADLDSVIDGLERARGPFARRSSLKLAVLALAKLARGLEAKKARMLRQGQRNAVTDPQFAFWTPDDKHNLLILAYVIQREYDVDWWTCTEHDFEEQLEAGGLPIPFAAKPAPLSSSTKDLLRKARRITLPFYDSLSWSAMYFHTKEAEQEESMNSCALLARASEEVQPYDAVLGEKYGDKYEELYEKGNDTPRICEKYIRQFNEEMLRRTGSKFI
jgi:hypothetical protein